MTSPGRPARSSTTTTSFTTGATSATAARPSATPRCPTSTSWPRSSGSSSALVTSRLWPRSTWSPRTTPGPRCRPWCPGARSATARYSTRCPRAARPGSPSWAAPPRSARASASRSSTRCGRSPHGSPSSTTQTSCSSCSATSSPLPPSAAPGPTTRWWSRSSPATLPCSGRLPPGAGRTGCCPVPPLRSSGWTPSGTSSSAPSARRDGPGESGKVAGVVDTMDRGKSATVPLDLINAGGAEIQPVNGAQRDAESPAQQDLYRGNVTYHQDGLAAVVPQQPVTGPVYPVCGLGEALPARRCLFGVASPGGRGCGPSLLDFCQGEAIPVTEVGFTKIIIDDRRQAQFVGRNGGGGGRALQWRADHGIDRGTGG